MNASRFPWVVVAALTLAATFAGPAPAGAEDRTELRRRLKAHQQELLVRKARKRLEAAAARALAPRTAARAARPARRTDPDVGRRFGDAAPLWDIDPRAPRAAYRPIDRVPLGAAAANVPINRAEGEEPGSSQNEPSIAAFGSYVLAAYNDWPSLLLSGSIQGYSYSVNGGQSFTDGGMIPSPPSFAWTSDPIITVDEKTGDFFYVGLLEDSTESIDPTNGVGIVRGIFTGTSFRWDTPRIVVLFRDSEHFIDKPWAVADSATGNLYVVYSDFFPLPDRTGNAIQFTRSRNRGVSWDPPVTLSSAAANGNVQGARPAVGPGGVLYVVWKEIGPIDPGSDFLRIRRSTNGGVSFGPEITVAEFWDNYGTGAPGFNRERSVALPSIAVDRSRTATRGRVYVAWNESFNWFDDAPLLGVRVDETEDNDAFAQADPFVVGQTLHGTFRDDADYDSWSFVAERDSSYVFWADSVVGSTYRLRVFCADSLTRLTYTGHPELPLDTLGNEGVMLWTAPESGLYYLDMTNTRIEGSATGSYRIRTGRAHRGVTDRARDHRDAFVAWSADGVGWLQPARIHDDPPHFDNWLPEVAVAPDGDVYAAWYDWRDAPAAECGGASSIYVGLSDNGGLSWTSLGPATDRITRWTWVESILIPNQGDYMSLYANDNAIYAAWTDGRLEENCPGPACILGTSDIYGAALSLLPVELQVNGTATFVGTTVTVDWQFVQPRAQDVTVYRRDAAGLATLGVFRTDAGGHLTVTDTTATAGASYVYHLGVVHEGIERNVGFVVISLVETPVALTVGPNPMRELGIVRFAVPQPGAAVEVSIHDLLGRRVRTLLRGALPPGPRAEAWDGADDAGRRVPPGLYLVRLAVDGRVSGARISLIKK